MATPLNKLPLETRLKIVEDLWDSIAAEEHRLALTDAQRAELDRRLDDYELDGDPGQPADQVLAAIRQSP